MATAEAELADLIEVESIAQSANEIILDYRNTNRVDQQRIEVFAIQADRAVRLARIEGIASVARANIRELASTARFIDSLNLEGPALQAAMSSLERLSEALRRILASYVSSVTDIIVPVRIYVTETSIGPVVEREMRTLLSEIGVVGLNGPNPITGSWYRRLFGSIKESSNTHTAQELRRAAEIQLIDRFQAGIDGATAGAVSSIIAALADTRGAVIQAGSVLLVKVDDKIIVRQLTPEQLLHWNENPSLFQDPVAALTELQRAVEVGPNRLV